MSLTKNISSIDEIRDIKLKQVIAAITNHDDNKFKNFVYDVCILIENAILKEKESCSFTVEKSNSIHGKVNELMNLFKSFDFIINVLGDMEVQTVYNVYIPDEYEV